MTDLATLYKNWFVPAVLAPLAREVIARSDIPATARVLDIACGTGIVARLIAPLVGPEGRVVERDVNLAMLARARRAAESERLHVEWWERSARGLPLDGDAFDLVVCRMEVQVLPDKPCAVAEMPRVLAPGGQLAIVVWSRPRRTPFFAAFAQAVRAHLGTPAIELPFVPGDPVVVAGLLQDAGVADVSVEPAAIMADYTRPDEFVALQVRASAAAIPTLKDLSQAAMDGLIATIENAMATSVQDATACASRCRGSWRGGRRPELFPRC